MERYLIYGLVVLVVLGAAWGKGYLMGSERLNDYISEQLQEEARINTERGKVTERVVIQYVKVKGDTQKVTETIEKEVIKYVESGLDSCPLSNRAVGLHNSAAEKRLPNATGPTDGSASTFKAADLTKACTENYAIYHQTADRLNALQTWIRDQQAVK